MNLQEQFKELSSLDMQQPGTWPVLAYMLSVTLVFVLVVGGGGYQFIVKDKVPKLEQRQAEEQNLKRKLDQKQQLAANLQAYRDQLEEMRRSFGGMLRQLPSRTEIESLVVDISQTALGSGLEQELFQPQNEVQREFYAEKPIKMRITGTYHDFGDFVSGVAALPRIVTLHDIKVNPPARRNTDNPDPLVLEVTAKTYRYLDEDDQGGAG